MNITLIAPPAAGKGTQAAKISTKYNVPHISTGDLLRNMKSTNLNEDLNKGNLINDDLITNLLKQRLQKKDCQNGYVLDGYPRNINQAKQYETLLKEINKKEGIVIILDLPKEVALKRITGRRICPNCNEVFNVILEDTKPKEDGICDKCHHSLIKREDDTEETFNKRYEVYQKHTEPLVNYYEEKGIAYHVNSGINSQTTTNQIIKIIGDVYDKH